MIKIPDAAEIRIKRNQSILAFDGVSNLEYSMK